MIGYVVLGAAIASWVWIAHEINNAPETKDEEYNPEDYYDEDPTTTCWHDDDHYPDTKI